MSGERARGDHSNCIVSHNNVLLVRAYPRALRRFKLRLLLVCWGASYRTQRLVDEFLAEKEVKDLLASAETIEVGEESTRKCHVHSFSKQGTLLAPVVRAGMVHYPVGKCSG